MRREGFCLDIEANGFFRQADKIWCIVIKDLQTGRKQTLYPFKESKDSVIAAIQGWVLSYDTPSIVFHNGLGYDILVIKKLLDIDFNVGPDEMFGKPVQFIDTFYLSMYCNPDRDGHSIEYHGQQLGLEKIDWRQRAIELGVIESNAPDGAEFMQWHDEMGVYCERDVDVNIKVFNSLMDEFDNQYGKSNDPPAHYKCGQKNHYLMACQDITGWKFDLTLAHSLQDKIQSMMFEIEQEVEPMLPPRKMKKGEEKDYSMPAKPYKANGDFSSHMLNFIEKHKGEVVSPTVVKFYGVGYIVESKKMLGVKLPMTLGNQDDLKDYLLEQGWKPTLWNYKKGPDNKPLRDPITRQLVPTTPKMQEQGKICENLLELEGDMVKKVVKWLSLRNRQSVLNGWVDNPRIVYDGRLSTGRTGITPTFRMKHSTVVNVPKASDKVLLGKEFRSLFTCEDGTLIAAGDAAALEGRVMGHYTFKYDGGATAKEILEGDPHSKNAKVFYPFETKAFDINADDFNKDDIGFKPYRDRSKNGFYACLPIKTKVLMSDGWRYFDEISEGDSILSFDHMTGNVVNDTVIKKHFFTDKEVFKYSNKWHSFECTEDHRWYGWRRVCPKGKERYKIFGYFRASDFTQEHNILLTAPWVGNCDSELSDDDCSLLGWIASEGYLKWSDLPIGPSSSFGNKRGVICSISQSQNKFYIEIEQLLNRMGADFHKYTTKKDKNDVHNYRLNPTWVRRFLDRIFCARKDKHDLDWTRIVLSMSRSNLESFYNAFYLGDGCMTSMSDIISQNTGNIFDAITTAALLLGKGRVTLSMKNGTPSEMKAIRVNKVKHMTCQEIVKTIVGVQDTFCLTTRNGSFLIWQDDFIGITGNCLYGAGPSRLAKTLGKSESEGERLHKAFWDANPAISQLKENVEKFWETNGKKFVTGIDGRQIKTRKKSALLNSLFQSCGAIAMEYAICFMDKWLGGIQWVDGMPCYIYKGYTVKRIGYYHDEIEYECDELIAEEVSRMIEKAITKAGEHLKLNVPLAGEGKIGKNWKEVH